jgi:hypothetical protein
LLLIPIRCPDFLFLMVFVGDVQGYRLLEIHRPTKGLLQGYSELLGQKRAVLLQTWFCEEGKSNGCLFFMIIKGLC